MHTDNEIIKKYLNGDEKSLEILVGRFLKPVYSYISKYVGDKDVAEDITQDVFLKVWKNLKKFDQKRSFKTWIFTIAKNSCIDYLRKKKTIPISNFDNEKGENIVANKLRDSAPLPDELFEIKNFSTPMLKALKKLSAQSQKILYLRYKDNFKFKEIASALSEPLNTVKSRHRRAVLELRSFLPENY